MKFSIAKFLMIIFISPFFLFINLTESRSQTPQLGGIMRIVDNAEGGSPIGAPWMIRGLDTNLIKPALETLLREDAKGNYHPWLATDWRVDLSKNTITLSLRQGVKFHDGTDFDADAVKWSIDQAIEAKALRDFKSVDIIDKYTVRINLSKYENNILNYLSGALTSIVSPNAYKTMGKEKAMWNPVGTGPFKFVSYERGTRLKFTKFENYWQKGKPYLDGLEILLMRDAMTQMAAMRAAESERVHSVPAQPEQAVMLKAQGFKILSTLAGTITLIPDSKNPDSPLSNKKVRQAISYAINRDAIVKTRGFGFWAPANQIPAPGFSGYIEEKEFGRYDVQKAKQLLAEAGYPKGFKISIIVMPALVDKDSMVILQRLLKEVGIEAELEFPDGGKYTAIRMKDGWKNGFLAQAARLLPTCNLTYNFYFHTSSGILPSFKRPDGFVEKLNESLATVMPEEKRMKELTKMLIDEAAIIPINYSSEIRVLQPNVFGTGFFEYGGGTPYTPENMFFGK